MTDPELARRVRTLEDIEAIRRLKAAYCAACDDDHDPDTLQSLFAPDGVWEVEGNVRNEGHAAIREWFQALRDSKRMRNTAHNVFNPIIEVDGDTARGHWRLLMLYTANTDDPAKRYQRIIGLYEEKYVRVHGAWKFQHLHCKVEESGPYAAQDLRR